MEEAARAVWSRGLLVGLALGAAAGACNAVTGTGKYVVVDCIGEACDGGGAGNDAGADSPLANQGCSEAGTVVIASCTDGALGRSVHTAPEDPRVILVPVDDKQAPYDPNCMIIRVGQTVTWRGNLGRHPLIQRENSTLPNPIPTLASGTEGSAQFACPGDYNFSCRNHEDSMLGTIRVIP